VEDISPVNWAEEEHFAVFDTIVPKEVADNLVSNLEKR
jgi:hypothetical protein